KNFITDALPFASARVGAGDIFVSEIDESDGSIARFAPKIALVNNISLDHKSLDELRGLFRDFVAKAETAVLNRDDAESVALGAALPREKRLSYGLRDADADLRAARIVPAQDGIDFVAIDRRANIAIPVRLRVPGRHNVANALAALAAAGAAGVPLPAAAEALAAFAGIRRRLEV